MAEQSAQNVVNQAQSVDDSSSIDVSGTSHISNTAGGVGGEEEEAQQPDNTNTAAPKDTQTTAPTSNYAEPAQPSHETDVLTSSVEDSNAVLVPSEKQQEPATNGDSGSYDESDDITYEHSASGDTIHPDPEAIKTEGLEQSLGEGKNERLSAVKRPTAFKPVSVTKNFLAKSAVGSTVAAKTLGDKGQSSRLLSMLFSSLTLQKRRHRQILSLQPLHLWPSLAWWQN